MTTPFRPIHPGDEERVAAEMGRELEEIGDVPGLRPLPGFTDRVMAAIADEPVPQPAIALGVALRRGRLGSALAAMGDAWRVAFGGPRPFAVRAQALALVLVLAIVTLGAGGAAVVGASRLLGLDGGPRPSAVEPSPLVSPPPSLPPSPSPSPSISPSPSLGPTPTPTENEPTETPEGSDDHGGGGGPGSGSGSGSGSGNSGSGSDSSGSGSSGSGSGSGRSGSDDSGSDDL